ncbi:MAG: polysaccharide deacetylase family protein [Chitinophagaceae bacterium]
MYFVKTPWWLALIYNKCVWHYSNKQKQLYLTFDDGPHPTITPFVLQQLKKYNAKATFFCVGENVKKHPEIYQQIINDGHAVGNHTYNHLNGWKTPHNVYLQNIKAAANFISSYLFRPPYGKISFKAIKQLTRQANNPYKIIMWDVLSGDFDVNLTADDCTNIVLKNTTNGSIIVYHDSEKAWDRLSVSLPKILEILGSKGFEFAAIY